MKTFMDENFLLQTETVQELYHNYVSKRPIIDCHLETLTVIDDHRCSRITELWLSSNHYKWHAILTNGIYEKYSTEIKRSDWDMFKKWIKTAPHAVRGVIGKLVLTIIGVLLIGSVTAQPVWDNPDKKGWSSDFVEVSIKSSKDNTEQMAYFRKTIKVAPQPLIISLHTWGGNYAQRDPLDKQIIEKDWNYIHPDFRGPNNTYKACGSSFVISDIDDAIAYALKNGKVDVAEIHIIGVSGGGYATLLSYMKSKHNIKSFSAWVPISDIGKWYYESIGRKQKYSKDIANATSNNKGYLDIKEAKQRSPMYMKTPTVKRKNSKLYIYAGIHDGYKGSVPITHSLNMYNKIIADIGASKKKYHIPDKTIIDLLVTRHVKTEHPEQKIGDRTIFYQNRYKDLIEIIIFDGGHELLPSVALDHIK